MRKIKVKNIQKISVEKYEKQLKDKRTRQLTISMIESINAFNQDFPRKLIGRTISLKRINQALRVYEYGGCSFKGGTPSYYCAIITSEGEVKLVKCYRSEDSWRIL